MSVTIRTIQDMATIDGYEWTGDNAQLVDLLNSMLAPYGPSGADPNPDMTAAQAAIDSIGGEIVDINQDIKHVKGRVY